MNSITQRLLFPFLIAFTFLFSACEQEQELTPNPGFTQTPNTQTGFISSGTLVGDWDMVALDYTGTSTTSSGGTTVTSNFSGLGKDFTYEITFSDNPKTFVATGGYVVALTSSIDGIDMGTQDVPISDASSSGSWSLVGNTLTMTNSATNETSTTEILRGNANSFAYDYAGIFGRTQSGASYNLTGGQVSFTRK